MKLLVLGKSGQVAQALLERGPDFPNVNVVAFGRPELDLEVPGSAAALIARENPDLVVNAAAYTAVDQAEGEAGRAFRINGEAVAEVAAATKRANAVLVHLSTDYVFDGKSAVPYTEEAPTNPQSVYGRSKLAGEEAVRSCLDRHLIIRTSWVYSAGSRNFVRTMMALADERDVIKVVDDQRGCPTAASDLADAVLRLGSSPLMTFGTFHLCGDGSTSWCGLARQVMFERERLGLHAPKIEAITSADFPTPAQRPSNSSLDCGAFESACGFRLPPWQHSLRPVVERLARAHAI